MISREEFLSKYTSHLNEKQVKAVQTINGPVLLLAVPGSGKTTVLVNRLGYMLYVEDINPGNILTLTYTIAATQDMKRRFEDLFGEDYSGNVNALSMYRKAGFKDTGEMNDEEIVLKLDL